MTVALLHAEHGGSSLLSTLFSVSLEFLSLLPLLFLACLFCEWLSRSSFRVRGALARRGFFAPFFGALLGVIPQCGLSAAAARLYASRLLSTGTLLAVFLSTSDEMLPILLAGGIPPLKVLSLVGVKLVFAALAGCLVNAVLRREVPPAHEDPSLFSDDTPCPCGCGGSGGGSGWRPMLLGTLRHTLSISLYLFLTMLAFDVAVSAIGEARLAELLSSAGLLGVFLSALVGLIPSCAVSVVLSELWAVGAISTGALLSGLSVGAGVGLLVLFRVNRPPRNTLLVTALLLALGMLLGLLVDLSGLGAVLRP